MNEVNATCKIVISAQPETVSTAQTTLRNMYNETQEKLTVVSRLMLSMMLGS